MWGRRDSFLGWPGPPGSTKLGGVLDGRPLGRPRLVRGPLGGYFGNSRRPLRLWRPLRDGRSAAGEPNLRVREVVVSATAAHDIGLGGRAHAEHRHRAGEGVPLVLGLLSAREMDDLWPKSGHATSMVGADRHGLPSANAIHSDARCRSCSFCNCPFRYWSRLGALGLHSSLLHAVSEAHQRLSSGCRPSPENTRNLRTWRLYRQLLWLQGLLLSGGL
mmetsp:Transcript_86362/g.180756  ORF Transcript_86362/g.180756 Transcript_86362/m.180756 type:complete len:218 (-) Transcript_86362:110-763(-)